MLNSHLWKTLAILFISCCCGFAADNNPRVIRLKGFHGLAIAPPSLFSPSNFPTLYGWWRPEGLTNATDGLAVDFWTDSSGHGLHMRSAGTPPLSTNNVQNGYRAVWFDATFLTNAYAVVQTNTLFVVLSHRIPGQAQTYAFTDQDVSEAQFNDPALYWDTDFNQPIAYAGSGLTSTSGPRTNTVTTYVIQFSNASGQFWTNGVSAVTSSIGGGDFLDGMIVGRNKDGTKPFKGYIIEMFCLTNTFATQGSVLNDGCNYLRAKYAHY